MSLGRDYLSDYAYEIEKEQERWESLCIKASLEASRGIWRAKDGRVLSVHEMETSHIQNCIKMLHRNHSPFEDVYKKMFEAELTERRLSRCGDGCYDRIDGNTCSISNNVI